MKITIIGVRQARAGYAFLFSNTADSCRQCDYNLPCNGSLENGRVYTVKKVLKKELPCILQSGNGKVVEVEESLKEVLIHPRYAIPGAIITLDFVQCNRPDCKNRERCFPLGLLSGDRCKVVKVGDEVTCSLGPRLVGVCVQREPMVS
jgi:hypothetical protein